MCVYMGACKGMNTLWGGCWCSVGAFCYPSLPHDVWEKPGCVMVSVQGPFPCHEFELHKLGSSWPGHLFCHVCSYSSFQGSFPFVSFSFSALFYGQKVRKNSIEFVIDPCTHK